ncbi:MOB kinase activator 2-like isoform X2 [Limulus polyphemus]|uniref:MOB kinase activator 2-like isoform X2 n=1 Tax=Limulus polyphemus TaxID=6850 RepID=A0ABM1BNA3_LIMPO|nr:MOB kinase activator 2-like isoform X2 [Limulus polyphemus]
MFVLNFVWKTRRKDKDAVAPCQEESKLYLEPAVLETTIQETLLREAIELPSGLDYNEWLASHTLSFFDHVNLIYGTISEFCTMSGCSDMTGPCNRQYLWFDEKGKKSRLAATQYVDYVMTFTQKIVNDESIFPTKFDKEFPASFESIVKKIHRLLFHVVAHVYHAHFKEVVLLNFHAHLNSLFSHFMLFNQQFNLVEEKETEVLHDLAAAMKLYSSGEQEMETLLTSKHNETDSFGCDKSIDSRELPETASPVKLGTPTTYRLITEESKRPISPSIVSQSVSSPSILSSITALRTRASSGGHSSSNSCAMDSSMFTGSSSITSPTASCRSSPVKFQ